MIAEALHTHTDVPRCPLCGADLPTDVLVIEGARHECPTCGRGFKVEVLRWVEYTTTPWPEEPAA